MSTLFQPGPLQVTVGSTVYPVVRSLTVHEALAPEIDSAEVIVPLGQVLGAPAQPYEPAPALGASVVVSASTWEWRGALVATRLRGGAGGRELILVARGPAQDWVRSFVPSFARSGLSGVVQAPGGPRFAPRTRSATTGGPDNTYYLGGANDWTLAQALEAYLAHIPLAGLPKPTLDTTGCDLSGLTPDTDLDGLSCWTGLATLLSHRRELVWRLVQPAAGAPQLVVREPTGAGSTVDLAAPEVLQYEWTTDATGTLQELEVRGEAKIYVLSIDCYTAGGGNLEKDWTTADYAARAAGDRSSPALRRFKLGVFALPDGSPSVTAVPVPTLPISTSTTAVRGSSPWLLFAQRSSDSAWESLQGRVSISVGGGRIWIEGIEPDDWESWSRIRLTLALSPRAPLSVTRTGGSGVGRGLLLRGGRRVVASGAAVRVSGASLATVTGTVEDDTAVLDAAADTWWAARSAPLETGHWTVVGLSTLAPGTRITSVLVPGRAARAVDVLVTARRIAWASGRPLTSSIECAPRLAFAAEVRA